MAMMFCAFYGSRIPFIDVLNMRYTRVEVWLTLFLLNTTIKHHLEKYQYSKPDFVESLSYSTYVDDLEPSDYTLNQRKY